MLGVFFSPGRLRPTASSRSSDCRTGHRHLPDGSQCRCGLQLRHGRPGIVGDLRQVEHGRGYGLSPVVTHDPTTAAGGLRVNLTKIFRSRLAPEERGAHLAGDRGPVGAVWECCAEDPPLAGHSMPSGDHVAHRELRSLRHAPAAGAARAVVRDGSAAGAMKPLTCRGSGRAPPV